jgi:beta-glucosidase
MNSNRKSHSLLLCLAGALAFGAASQPLYLDRNQPLETRVEDLLSRMTLEEKIAMVHDDTRFTTAGIPRLSIPTRCMSDGPNGVREEIMPNSWDPAGRTDDFSTAMPVGICLASTWDPDLAHREGEAIAQEARARGKDIMLGPGVNILRTPLCGRNFEYLGEDPFLASRMAVGFIQGEQSQEISSCVKHFALNNQEFERGTINVEVDDRTLHEIYLPAFKAAVQEGGVWCVMGAYNQLRHQYCCENDYLLNQILKNDWRFKGLVISDWGGAHSTRDCALNGLDLENGTEGSHDFYFAQTYLDAIKKGELPMEGLDEKVRRNLRVMFATHVFDTNRNKGSINTAVHQAVARHAAEEGIVLLKNDGLLPLDTSKIKTIAVIGDNAVRLQAHGGDSSCIKAFYERTPLQGILNRAGGKVNVTFSQGYQNGLGEGLVARAVAAAKAADVVIFVGGLNHERGLDCEGTDRRDMKLPYGQEKLISEIIAANPHVIVVLEGMMAEMGSWLAQTPAVLQAWYPGMEGGNALAGVLFGDVNPSGKLPCTFPKKLADSPAHALGAYPGTNGTVTYAEGLLVGYRWFDTKNIEPLFPFGFGLSYTTFKYSNLKVLPGDDNGKLAVAQFEIQNTGTRDGAEVAQLYIHQGHPSLSRPEKELKGFKKVFLKAGATETVSIPLDYNAFAFYDAGKKSWVAEKGNFDVLVGGSSRDITLHGTYQMAETVARKD